MAVHVSVMDSCMYLCLQLGLVRDHKGLMVLAEVAMVAYLVRNICLPL